MGDLSKLKVAVGQPELVDGSLSRTAAVQDRLVSYAVEAGADLLVFPGSLSDASDVHIIALNDSRIDVAGSVVILEAAGESYQIGLGAQPQGCDFAVYADVEPWAVSAPTRASWPGIVLRPVGVRNVDKKVLAYDGGTSVFASDGTLLARLRDDFEEDFALVSLAEPTDVAEPCKDKLLAALVKTVRRFDEQVLSWKPKWVIGLSGGLDSSIVAALLTLALGPERVCGFGLSTQYNSDATKRNAQTLAEALGIQLRVGSIADVVTATELAARQFGYGPSTSGAGGASVGAAGGASVGAAAASANAGAGTGAAASDGSEDAGVAGGAGGAGAAGAGGAGGTSPDVADASAITGLALENVQARVRGHLLSTFAALEGGVVANNGNRVEATFGYATLYGDSIGALAPIGDLTKTRLFELARAINGQPGVEIIPENLLPRETDDGYEWDIMPSAELAEGQRDPMKWFYHDWLVEQLLDSPSVDVGACSVLSHFLDDRLASSAVGKWVSFYGLDDPNAFLADFDWALSALQNSVFKRIQAPPAIRVASPASIASALESQGAREPSVRYRELRSRIALMS